MKFGLLGGLLGCCTPKPVPDQENANPGGLVGRPASPGCVAVAGQSDGVTKKYMRAPSSPAVCTLGSKLNEVYLVMSKLGITPDAGGNVTATEPGLVALDEMVISDDEFTCVIVVPVGMLPPLTGYPTPRLAVEIPVIVAPVQVPICWAVNVNGLVAVIVAAFESVIVTLSICDTVVFAGMFVPVTWSFTAIALLACRPVSVTIGLLSLVAPDNCSERIRGLVLLYTWSLWAFCDSVSCEFEFTAAIVVPVGIPGPLISSPTRRLLVDGGGTRPVIVGEPMVAVPPTSDMTSIVTGFVPEPLALRESVTVSLMPVTVVPSGIPVPLTADPAVT